MKDTTEKPKKSTDRPSNPLPDRIPDTPENIMRALVSAPPKKRWEWGSLKKSRYEAARGAAWLLNRGTPRSLIAAGTRRPRRLRTVRGQDRERCLINQAGGVQRQALAGSVPV